MFRSKVSGFTLVELAIVLMIIGLLIGGILKGQELINNARINTAMRQMGSYDAAVLTFMDSYGAKPGDITNPSTRLPNCSAAKCNIAGDGDGGIGSLSWLAGDEANTFWLHLAAANLISGFDASALTWTTGSFGTGYPRTPIGGVFYLQRKSQAADAYYPNGLYGHYMSTSSDGAWGASVPINQLAQIDRKMDDGKPWVGNVVYNGAVIAQGAAEYPAVTDLGKIFVKTAY